MSPSPTVRSQTHAQWVAQVLREASSTSPAVFLQRLDEGVNLRIEDRRHNTLLHHLARKGRTGVFRQVIEQPEDRRPLVNRVNDQGETAMHEAAAGGHLDMVLRLIAAGADVHKADRMGNLPLHAAARGWHMEVVNALLDAGSDVNSHSESSVPPLAKALYEWPKTPDEAQRQLATMHVLLDRGAHPGIPENDHVLPNLHRAIGHPLDALRLLLDQGVDPNQRDVMARTALMIACQDVPHRSTKGFTQILAHTRAAIAVLIDAGADVTLKDENGSTALHLAVCQNDAGWIQQLVNAGADPLAQDEEGKTPMDLAVDRQGVPLEAAILALTLAGERGHEPALPTRSRPRL